MSSSSSRTNENSGLVFSTGLFTISAYLFLREARKRRQVTSSPFSKLYRRIPRHQASVVDGKEHVSGDENGLGNSLHNNKDNQSMVSSRGVQALAPPIPYLKQFLTCLQDPCDAAQNPGGYIALCLAENKLILDLLAERCMQVGTATAAFADFSVYCYNSFLGMPVAREAASYFLARRFLFPENPTITIEQALQHIQARHVALGAGAAALLNHLFFLLGEEADACLIPAPYYAAFENDMNLVAGIIPFPIEQANPVIGPTEQELNLAYLQAKSKGLRPRFLLLTNPNNPLAVIYRPEIILRTVQWARKKNMHTIVDEIYALSVHKKNGHAFQSIIRILNNDLGDDVHMVWAVSKDFGASGLRYALVYSQNDVLLEGLASMSTFTCVSGPVQYLISELLTDDYFVDSFLDVSRLRLLSSYRLCTSKLEEMVLPYIPAEAGMFVYVDFSSLLPEKSFEWEERLSDLFFAARIVLTPGESQRDTAPGMFRLCYAWVSPDVLKIAMERLSKLVAQLRRMDFDDVKESISMRR